MAVVDSHSSEVSREKAKLLLAGFLSANEGGYRRVRGIFGIGKSCLIKEVIETHAMKFVGDSDYRKLDAEAVEETLLSILPPESLAKLGGVLIVPRRLKSPRLKLIIEEVQEAYGANDRLVILFSVDEIGNIPKESLDLMSGDQHKTALKWVLEERSDLGPIPIPQPKPTLSRSDRDKVIPVDGWKDSEVRDFVASTFQSLLGDGEGNNEALKRIADAVLLWAGGHPDLVNNVCKWLKANLMIVKEHENHWRNALGSREALEEFIRVETEASLPTLRGIVEEICKHLSPPTKSYVADMVHNGGKINPPAVFADLRRVGLATQDSHLIRLIKDFHPNSTARSNETKESYTASRDLAGAKNEIALFLKSTWDTLFDSPAYGGDRAAKELRPKYEIAQKELRDLHDHGRLASLAQKINGVNGASEFQERMTVYNAIVNSLAQENTAP